MIIVDAHTHLGSEIYPGRRGGNESKNPDDYANDYAHIMRAAGVDKGFIFTLAGLVQDPASGNDELARARDRFPDLMLPWGSVDPYWSEAKIRHEMRRCIRELGFYGFKLHPWLQGFSLMIAGMEVIAEECAEIDVPVIFHDGTAFYCTALQVAYFARAHPKVKVVSGHGGLAELWRDTIEPAKELPNYYIVLSGPVQQGMQEIYDEVGADKLMFGSDGGSFHPVAVTWYLRRVRALRAPPEDLARILGLNALRLVGLAAPPAA
jgi:predicted TIM-barrel fold metal-dependent hydrolase